MGGSFPRPSKHHDLMMNPLLLTIDQIMNIKSHSDRQKKYVTFKNQNRNKPL